MPAGDLAQVIAMAALWGGSFLFMRVATPEFGPVPLVAVRLAITAAVLLPFFLGQPERRNALRAHAGRLLVLGVLNAAVPFSLFSYATLHVTAGFAAILNATAPLFAAVVARAWLGDRLTPGAVLGLLTGVAGVMVLVGGLPESRPDMLGAVAAGLVAAFCYGVSASFVKRYLAGVSTWVTTMGSFGIAAVVLAPVAAVQWPANLPSAGAFAAVAVLAVACTSLPNLFYFRLVLRAGPARAMIVAFLIPAFGMLWGVLILGERVTASMLAGCATILLGTALVAGLLRLPVGKTHPLPPEA